MADSSDSGTENGGTIKKVKNNEKPKKKVANQRFCWKPEMVESLLGSKMEVKTKYEFNGLDFESDCIFILTYVRINMASR